MGERAKNERKMLSTDIPREEIISRLNKAIACLNRGEAKMYQLMLDRDNEGLVLSGQYGSETCNFIK